jgi:hypothetical protein
VYHNHNQRYLTYCRICEDVLQEEHHFTTLSCLDSSDNVCLFISVVHIYTTLIVPFLQCLFPFHLPLLNHPLLFPLLFHTLTPQWDNRPIDALKIRSTFIPRIIQPVHLLLHRRVRSRRSRCGFSWRPYRGRPCPWLSRTCHVRHRSVHIYIS